MKASGSVRGVDWRRVIAQAGLAAHLLRSRAVDEAHVAQFDLTHRELVFASDHQPVGRGIDLDHVPRPRLAQVAKPVSLPNCVQRGALMAAKLTAGGVDHSAYAHRKPPR